MRAAPESALPEELPLDPEPPPAPDPEPLPDEGLPPDPEPARLLPLELPLLLPLEAPLAPELPISDAPLLDPAPEPEAGAAPDEDRVPEEPESAPRDASAEPNMGPLSGEFDPQATANIAAMTARANCEETRMGNSLWGSCVRLVQ